METRASKHRDGGDDVLSIKAQMEEAIKAQDAKLEKRLAEMFEAIKLLSTAHASAPSQSQSSPSSAPVFIDPDPNRRLGTLTSYSGVTRLGKIDFPRFGGDKVKEWLFKVEQFFAIDHTPADTKIPMVSIHLDGVAADWHQNLLQSEMNVTNWEMYKLLVKERFDDVWDDPIAELKKLQETEGIVEYHEKFENI